MPGHCHAKRLLDELQLWHHCCGHHGYQGWFGVQWVSSHYLDPNDQDVVNWCPADSLQTDTQPLPLQPVAEQPGRPLSNRWCPILLLQPPLALPCLQNQLSDLHTHPLFDPQPPNLLNLWAQGRHGVLRRHLQGLVNALGSTLAVTFLLQTLVPLGLCYLHMALEGLGRVFDGEGEAQGYLFPGGLRDKLRAAWLAGGAAHRPAPEEAPEEEARPKESLPET